MKLSAIEKERKIIDEYMQVRLKELTCRGTPTKRATVNRELTMLSKAFSLVDSRKWQMASLNPCSTAYCKEPLRHRLDRKVVGIRPGNDYVFSTRSGRRISARNLQRAFEKACAEATIDDLVFHDLRHTFGTWLAQNGVDIYTIARYMGHKSLESTKRYLHYNAESLKAGIGTVGKMAEKLQRIAEVDG